MALSVDRINGISGDLAIKAPVRVATTANITLAGFQTIDGVTPVEADTNLRVLVKNQTDTTQNGIYNMASGTWLRSTDFNGAYDVVKGTEVTVQEGTVNGGFFFVVATADPITIGTSALTFTASAASAAANLPNLGDAGASKFIQSDATGAAWEYKTAAQTRTALSLVVGTDVQAYDPDIATVAASQAEMEAGTESALRTVSPLRVAQAVAALSSAKQIQPISASVAANALTISASALSLDFRSATIGSGAVTNVTGTPANLVISSGSTLGTVSAVQSRIVVLALNNAGTIELAAVNISGGNDLTETGVVSTTAEGGAGAADSASVIYSTTARTNVAYRVLGYVESTQATAGTWATALSTIQGAGGNAVTAMSSLGYGQTWQSVVGSRALSTTYYNTTGRPIAVSVGVASGGTAGLYLTINSVLIRATEVSGAGNAGVFGIVPPGGAYSATSTATLNTWAELR